MTGPFRETREGLALDIRVTPNGDRAEILGLRAGEDGRLSLALKVAAPPEGGRANREALALLARALGLPKSALALKSGETGRNKVVSVAGNRAELEALIAPYRNSFHGNS